jgi:hypothetical protein
VMRLQRRSCLEEVSFLVQLEVHHPSWSQNRDPLRPDVIRGSARLHQILDLLFTGIDVGPSIFRATQHGRALWGTSIQCKI